jgi:uncharacterized repeat protein (TIGR01451 family)
MRAIRNIVSVIFLLTAGLFAGDVLGQVCFDGEVSVPCLQLEVTWDYDPRAETIQFTYTLTNNTFDVIRGLTLDPGKAGVELPAAIPELGEGGSTSVNGQYRVTATDYRAGVVIIQGAIATGVASDYDFCGGVPPCAISSNTSGTEVPLEAKADISIAKTDSVDPVAPGGDLSYTITVTNNGPSDIGDVRVEDSLPEGVTYLSSSGNCSLDAPVIYCQLNALDAGSSETIRVDVRVNGDATGTITNCADAYIVEAVFPPDTPVRSSHAVESNRYFPEAKGGKRDSLLAFDPDTGNN